jgi:death-associated protein 6
MELTLEEMEDEDSPYIFEDRLQKKFVKVWNKLCELQGRSTSSGRPIHRRFRYQGNYHLKVLK